MTTVHAPGTSLAYLDPPSRAVVDPMQFPADAAFPMEALVDNGVYPGSVYYDPAFPLDAVNLKTAMMHQPRLELLDKDHLEQMTIAKANGATFPAIIVRKTGPGMHVLIDGRHRAKACLANGLDGHGALVIDCTDIAAEDIANDMNVRNGKQTTSDEKLLWAQRLTERPHNPLSTAKAAAKANISETRLRRFLKSSEGRDRAGKVGITNEWNRIEATSQGHLSTVQYYRPFKEACLLVLAARMPSPDVQRLAADLRALGDVDEQLAHIESTRQSLAAQINNVRTGTAAIRSPQKPIVSKTKALLNALSPEEIAARVTSQAHKAEVMEALDELSERIRKVRRELAATAPAPVPAKPGR
jgi:hypothetical protein